MRTFIIAVMALLVPFTMYAAGCRQDQSAFPGGPEMKNLAAATVEEKYPTVPYIPKIDPEVANAPESSNARLVALADRQSRLSGQYEAPGLFVLPDMNSDIMAMAPGAPYAQTVVPIGERIEPLPEPVPALGGYQQHYQTNQNRPEFWSRPMMPHPSAGMVPPGMGAMMPPAAAPAPHFAPPPAAPLRPLGGGGADRLIMPETIPGVYLGSDYEPVAVSSPPESRQPAGEFVPPPPLSSPPAASMMQAVLPIPASVPAPATLTGWKPSGPHERDDTIQAALAPLPRLEEPASLEWPSPLPNTRPISKSIDLPSTANSLRPVSPLAEPMPSLAETLEKASESLALLGMMENKPLAPPASALAQTQNDTASKPALSTRDMYRMDLWDDKVSALGQVDSLDNDMPASIMDYETSRLAKESRATSVLDTERDAKEEQAAALEPLQKIQLRPLRPTSALQSIDAEVAPPPLVF